VSHAILVFSNILVAIGMAVRSLSMHLAVYGFTKIFIYFELIVC
jgi:hypothetical protein